MTPDLASIEHVRICRTCLRLYQKGRGGLKRCDCHKIHEPTWPGFDFNEYIHLCECCRVEIVPSGSKWSSFFCGRCRSKAIAVNARAHAPLVPFARHSLTSGLGLRAARPGEARDSDARASGQLVGDLGGFFASIDVIFAFGRDTLRDDLAVLDFPEGQDVDLAEFLRAAGTRRSSEDASEWRGSWWGTDVRFRHLCNRLRESSERIHGPDGPLMWQAYLSYLPIEMGFTRCEVCGEYRGSTREGYGESFSIKCLCDGLVCRRCGERKVHRPISDYYNETTGSFTHVPHFMPPICPDCRND